LLKVFVNLKINAKHVLACIGAALLLLAVIVFASNFALVATHRHDGGLHLFEVFGLLGSAREQTARAARMGLLLGAVIAFFSSIAILRRFNSKELHGSARFASDREIKKAGLQEKTGIIVGKKSGKFLLFDGTEHVMVYAPTRGGKGVGVVIPNMLNWPGSAIVLDIKKENYQLTAGFRKHAGQDVYLFDPFDPNGRTARYNPLAYVCRDNTTDLYDDLQRIAAMLFPVEGRAVDPFWAESGRTAFMAIGGYVAETPELPFTIGEILRQFAASADIANHFKSILEARVETRPLSQQCKTAMNDFLASSDNTLQSIRKTVTSKLGLWLNARIDAATSGNDFDLRELRRKPVTIYLGVTPDNLARIAPLLNLFFQQAVDLNTRVLPEHDKSLKHQLLLMMDEFRALGNVEIIAKGVSYVAGYNIRIVTIVQSPAQLREVYGPDAATNYMTNHAVEVVFTPKEHDVATQLSERFGFDTVEGHSKSRGLGFSKSSRSLTTSDQRRALMLPQELVLTPYEDEYILKGGIRPIKAKKILYYKEAAFKRRLLPPPVTEPHSDNTNSRIVALERQIETLSQTLATRIERAPTIEEATANTQPADGEDGTQWILPNDLGNAFNEVKITDNSDVTADADRKVSEYLDSVLGTTPSTTEA